MTHVPDAPLRSMPTPVAERVSHDGSRSPVRQTPLHQVDGAYGSVGGNSRAETRRLLSENLVTNVATCFEIE